MVRGGGQQRGNRGANQQAASAGDPAGHADDQGVPLAGAAATNMDSRYMAWLSKAVACHAVSGMHRTTFDHEIIGLLFSASWSPPCRLFTPMLIEGYRAIREAYGEHSFQVLLIPLDADEKEWHHYIEDMPWMSLQPSSREDIARLLLHFRIEQVPTLVIVDSSGLVVSRCARGTPGQGFGFGCEPLAAFDYLRQRSAQVQQDKGAAADKARLDASEGGAGAAAPQSLRGSVTRGVRRRQSMEAVTGVDMANR